MKVIKIAKIQNGKVDVARFSEAIIQSSGVIRLAAEFCGVEPQFFHKALCEHEEIAVAWQFAMVMIRDKAFEVLKIALEQEKSWAVRLVIDSWKSFVAIPSLAAEVCSEEKSEFELRTLHPPSRTM